MFLGALGQALTSRIVAWPSQTETRNLPLSGGARGRTLRPKASSIDPDNPIKQLDVSILQDHALGPLLGIDDPRPSERMPSSAASGVRENCKLVDKGEFACAFSKRPTNIEDLKSMPMAVVSCRRRALGLNPSCATGCFVTRSVIISQQRLAHPLKDHFRKGKGSVPMLASTRCVCPVARWDSPRSVAFGRGCCTRFSVPQLYGMSWHECRPSLIKNGTMTMFRWRPIRSTIQRVAFPRETPPAHRHTTLVPNQSTCSPMAFRSFHFWTCHARRLTALCHRFWA
ncbi:MAG: hypothetical protein CM1200mP29_07050 [Verrucomicrobiota bacterium]|nr:MAG: hypothetical protein CM1200mP29_07050 [Verrucomicrobiota bacterium]